MEGRCQAPAQEDLVTTSSNFDLTSPAVAQRILGRTRATHRKLLPKVALVARAMAGAGRPVEAGVPAHELAAPLPLKAATTVDVLQATFKEDAALAQHIEGVLAQFRHASEVLAASAGSLEEAQVQALKGAAVFLSRFHEAVKRDAMLAQLFPPPEVLQADAE